MSSSRTAAGTTRRPCEWLEKTGGLNQPAGTELDADLIAMVIASLVFYVPVALLALHFHWGIVGVWAGIVALIGLRLLTNGVRFLRRRWIVLGAA